MNKIASFTTLVVAAAITFISCKKDEKVTPQRQFFGAEQKLGDGTARSFVKLDESGKPEVVGISISEKAMNSLPHDMTFLVLPVPAEAGQTQFKYVGLDYMPHGHEPAQVYDKPHFDVHFYKVTPDVVKAMGPQDPKLNALPDAAFLPADYISTGSVPQMGHHWIDKTSPELAGKPFEQTLIYGSYDSKVIFIEPMITTEFMKKGGTSQFAIKQPQKYATTGLYPTAYTIRYDAGTKEYLVELGKFENKQVN
ncbi:DUF5602 domain-containing protein [Tellurirhabdus rosea]|uniref:DUF5602 domain-containing protein n=1 Tax=Tellurirhabdus rosea TaxID=2674997 RepID=UPI002257532A|nr:DUF5602 domain-containing protein [Tellurirhabdus rosea]